MNASSIMSLDKLACIGFVVVLYLVMLARTHLIRDKTLIRVHAPVTRHVATNASLKLSSTAKNIKEKQPIVIVIPYRDRAVHYQKIMEHLPTIIREKWNIHTILVEQDDKAPFRRAWLINIGIAEAKKRFKDDKTCVVTHDVDMLADSNVDYGWCDRPTQLCSELSCFGGGVPYKKYAGGVVEATLKDWYAINGYTNTAVGWGGEDDDLHHRFRIIGLLTGGSLRRPPKGFGKCHCLNDGDHTKRERDSQGYRDIVAKIGRMKRDSDEWKTDGLNSLKYHTSEETVDKYGTIHLKVTVNNIKPHNDLKKEIVMSGMQGTNVLDRCSNKLSGPKWDTFASMVRVLSTLNANYSISHGTVLFWYRDCSLGHSDIDMDIEFGWFMENKERLHEALLSSGWAHMHTFGKHNQFGYEESWKKNGIKTDLFSIAYVDGRYINGMTVRGVTHPCDSFLERQDFFCNFLVS